MIVITYLSTYFNSLLVCEFLGFLSNREFLSLVELVIVMNVIHVMLDDSFVS